MIEYLKYAKKPAILRLFQLELHLYLLFTMYIRVPYIHIDNIILFVVVNAMTAEIRSFE